MNFRIGGEAMKTTVVRYKVKPDRAEENIGYISKVFEQLKQELPPGLRYVSMNCEDGVSFIHIAILDDDNMENPLPHMRAFKEFTSQIRDRCDEPPVATSANMVGAYRMFQE